VGDGKYVYGCQFHPEKSGETGLKIIKNFSKLMG
jgi:glutamine amidotransferase